MINFTTETQSTQRKPKREWTRIDANKEKLKTNRGWTQIYADNPELLRSSQEKSASFRHHTVLTRRHRFKK
jgi:hypothetical protein